MKKGPEICKHEVKLHPLCAAPEVLYEILVAIVSQNSFVLGFWRGIAQLSRDMLQHGVSCRCVCVKLGTRG